MDYEIIDLSAKGPNRGLLVAFESIHPVRPAPRSGVLSVTTIPDARLRQSQVAVYAAMTTGWLSTKAIAVRSGRERRAVLQALRRLWLNRVIERQSPEQCSFTGNRQLEWRRRR